MASAKLDYADVLKTTGLSVDDPQATPVLKEVNKFNSLVRILAFLGIDVKQLAQDFIKGLIEKVLKGKGAGAGAGAAAPKPAETPTGTATAPPASTTPTTPWAEVPGPSTPRTLTAANTSFLLKPFWFQHGAGAPVESKEERDKILRGDDPLVEGDRFAGDCDIIQNGAVVHIAPNSQEANDLLWHDAAGTTGEANTQRMRWFFEDGDGIAEIHDNADGFNPVIKIPRGSNLEKGRDYQTGRLYGVFTFADGSTEETNRLPSLRIKR